MTKKRNSTLKRFIKENLILQKFKMEKEKELNEVCEECEKREESVTQNLVMHGYKICNSCKLSKTLFPI